jgi:hypothetical protein
MFIQAVHDFQPFQVFLHEEPDGISLLHFHDKENTPPESQI